MSDKKKKTYSEIDYNNELSFYFFREYNEEGKLIETYENINQTELNKLRKRLIDEAEGKPKTKKKKAEQRAEEMTEIDSMMENMLANYENPEENKKADAELPARQVAPAFNFQENRTKAESQAANLLKQLLKFYLSEEYIAENEYIKAKIAVDQMSLTGLISQVKLSEAAIFRLMESIESGEVHPRMFEVLAGMQRVYIDLLKMQTLSMVASEEHLKKLKNDYDYYQSATIPAASETKEIGEGETHRGTRDFLKDLHSEGEDVEFEE